MQPPDFKLASGTWVLVADGEKALILENTGTRAAPTLAVIRELEQDNPSTRDQGASPPGRMYDTGPNQRSAMEQTDWHQLAEDRFAKDAAELLYAYAHQNRFKEIVLCAAPRLLSELRKALHPEVAGRVIGEVPKDLTNHPIDEITRHLVGEP